MSTSRATIAADADGTIRLQLPLELRSRLLRVDLTVEPIDGAPDASAELLRRQRILDATRVIRAMDPFTAVQDPVAWQRALRADRALPVID